MGESDIHESAARLYEAAKQVGITGKSAVARALGESPQAVNNWEERGVSVVGALNAQARFGCDANWIRDGSGSGVLGWPFRRVPLAAVLALAADDRAYVEGVLAQAIAEVGSKPTQADIENFRSSHVRVRKSPPKRKTA
jgi:hypothetical protein